LDLSRGAGEEAAAGEEGEEAGEEEGAGDVAAAGAVTPIIVGTGPIGIITTIAGRRCITRMRDIPEIALETVITDTRAASTEEGK